MRKVADLTPGNCFRFAWASSDEIYLCVSIADANDKWPSCVSLIFIHENELIEGMYGREEKICLLLR